MTLVRVNFTGLASSAALIEGTFLEWQQVPPLYQVVA